MQETLDLDDRGVLKAASALAGGVARKGETCGALLGSMMAICQIVGRESLQDIQAYRKAMEPCDQMYVEFKQRVGHTVCREIHKILYGRGFDLCKQEEYEAFLAAGGHGPGGCPAVCEKAVRIAVPIVLDLTGGR